MNPKDIPPPLVLIAAVSEKNRMGVKKRLKEIGKQWRQERAGSAARDVVFTWMDAGKWGKWLKGTYGIADAENADVPSVVIADHSVCWTF
jgi:thioredoxin domain-containing protein 5